MHNDVGVIPHGRDVHGNRTRLYNLQPRQTQEGLKEGLISYLLRLAQAHWVRPRDLVRLVLADGRPDIANLCYNSFYVEYANTLNGLGKYAKLFAERLNELTGRQNLGTLTMLPWADLIPDQSEGFIARQRRWCPHCLVDQLRRSEDPFLPLAWSLEQYRHCAIHKTALEERCPHCDRIQHAIPNIPSFTTCCHCGCTMLLQHGQQSKQKGLAIEQAVASILAHSDHPTRAQFQSVLSKHIASIYKGNRAAFCRHMGWNAWGVNGWLDKNQRISFPKLLELYVKTDLRIGQIIGDMTPSAAANEPQNLQKRARRPKFSNSDRARIAGTLLRELSNKETASLEEIARTFGTTRSALKYWFPEDCAQLSLKRRARVALKAERGRAVLKDRVRNVINNLIDEGRQVSRRAVDQRLKSSGLALARPEVRELYYELISSALADVREGDVHQAQAARAPHAPVVVPEA